MRVASEMYQRDLERQGEAQERQAAIRAAEEVGLPEEYLHRAAAEVHARRVEQVRRRRRWRNGLLAATGVLALFGITLAGVRTLDRPVTRPAPYQLHAQEGWVGQFNRETRASVTVKDSAVILRVDRFAPDGKGTYFANADTYQVPDLGAYRSVRFRVRGSGLPYVRLYLENGPLERWRSALIPVTPQAQEVRLPLDQLERLTRARVDDRFRRQEYRKPGRVERLSIKTGDFVNDVSARGEVIIDRLAFE
ncbi:MAG: hypothetical protein RMJ43_13755 [Chloroherpetonaceae bacterium]|nr:hypothetical protein [Chthonomonadaceae bacterium]MDW8208894.1 hypothetical protein [Chloroherpetonaceae bacterium]